MTFFEKYLKSNEGLLINFENGSPQVDYPRYKLILKLIELLKQVDTNNITEEVGYVHAFINGTILDPENKEEWSRYTAINFTPIKESLTLNILSLIECLVEPFKNCNENTDCVISGLTPAIRQNLLYEDVSDMEVGKSLNMLLTNYIHEQVRYPSFQREDVDSYGSVSLKDVLYKFNFLLQNTSYKNLTKERISNVYTTKYIKKTTIYLDVLYKLVGLDTAITIEKGNDTETGIDRPESRNTSFAEFFKLMPFILNETVLLIEKPIIFDRLPPHIGRTHRKHEEAVKCIYTLNH